METPTNWNSAVLCLGFAAAVLSGCATDTDLETAFCDSLGRAPATVVVATENPSDAPSVAIEDENAEVTLVDIGAERGGSIKYVADEPGHFAFGLDSDIPFAVTDAAGVSVPIAVSVQGSSTCGELAVRHTVLLEPATYTVTFGPTDRTTVHLVAEESNDDLAL